MQGRTRRSGRWRSSAALIGIALAAGCSVYQPLDQGSTVPWASAPRGGATALATGARNGAVASLTGATYRVRPADRLGALADRFGLSVAALAEANGLTAPYVIRVGQEIRVPEPAPGAGPREIVVAQGPGGSTAGAAIAVGPLSPQRGASEAPSGPKRGAGGTQVAALDLTPLPPRTIDAAAPPTTATQTPNRKPEKVAAVGASAGEGYTVRSGETLSGIAGRLEVGLSELAKANGIQPPYRVYAGQKLRVPGGGEAYRTTVVDLGNAEPRTVRLATGAAPPLQGDDFLWPVNGKVIGKFGPIDQWRRRDGIDIAAPRGAPVLAAQDGIVAYAGNGIRGYGEMILLRHDQGYITTYAHNASVLVEVGDVVRRGRVIARVGDSGDATQSMLHFELRKGRKPIDPETRLVRDTTTLASTE